MDASFLSRPLNQYFQEITQDFLQNKRLFFKFSKGGGANKNASPYSLSFEGGFKTPVSDTTLFSKDFKCRQSLILSPSLSLSMRYLPYQSNGVDLALKGNLSPFRFACHIKALNTLSSRNHLSVGCLKMGYIQDPYKFVLSLFKLGSKCPELELSLLLDGKKQGFEKLNFGLSLALSDKKTIDLMYYELFAKVEWRKYQFLGALTSNKGTKGTNKLTPGGLTLAFRKTVLDNVLNLVLEHDLHEKKSVLTAVYESSIEDAILLKNFVNSEYQVSASMVYKLNEFIRVVHSSSINIKRFFNQGEKYKLGLGVIVEV